MTEDFSKIGLSDRSIWTGLQVVAMDIDGTLTSQGRLTGGVIAALAALRSRGLKVCLVTGRPSGWVQGLVTYLPVDAAIAENGGVIFLGSDSVPLLRDAADGSYNYHHGVDPRFALRKMFSELKRDNPDLHVTEDNSYRMSDFTFHVGGFASEELMEIRQKVELQGLAFTWSTIHGHIMPHGQEKGAALEWLLSHWSVATGPAKTTLTIGDSPNDSSMFCADKFPLSAGVANIIKYRGVMDHYPKFISTLAEGEGFIEIVNTLLNPNKP